jgi:hypothetical protein
MRKKILNRFLFEKYFLLEISSGCGWVQNAQFQLLVRSDYEALRNREKIK